MNQAQRKYAMERINALEARALKNALDRHTTRGKTLTSQEKLKLIASYDVPLKRDVTVYTDLGKAYDFSRDEVEAKTDTKKLDVEKAKIEKAFNSARDELMLGDAAKAFDLIQKLEKEWAKS